MDEMLDPNLYFSTPGPFRVNAFEPLKCALGQVIYAGTKWNSRATYAHAPPPDYIRPTPHYLLVYTLEGEADYADDTGLTTVLEKGSLIWAIPGVNQSYGPRPGSEWSELFVWFSGKIFDLWQRSGLPGEQTRHLHLEPADYWIDRILAVVQPPNSGLQETALVRLCRLQQILAEAAALGEIDRYSAEDLVWCEEACDKIAEAAGAAAELDEIAESMNMSYSAFRKRFTRLMGITPGKYRTRAVHRLACERLVETEKTVYQIAEELGFHDQFHFSRRFKQLTGLSPTSFRRQVTNRSKRVSN